MAFRAKWAMGCLALAAVWTAFALTQAMLLLGLAGGIVAVFGLAIATDWKGLATAMRRSQTEHGLRQAAEVYRGLGFAAVALGLAFLAVAVIKAA